MPSKKALNLVLAAALSAFLFSSCSSGGRAITELESGSMGKGKIADSDGDIRSFSDFHGGILLVNFWASWCVECLAEFPTLVNLQRQFGPDELQVITVLEDDDPENLKQLSISSSELGFPILIDAEGVLKRRFDVRGLPTTVLLGCGRTPIKFADPLLGGEVEKVVGAREWDSAPVVQQLRALAGKHGC